MEKIGDCNVQIRAGGYRDIVGVGMVASPRGAEPEILREPAQAFSCETSQIAHHKPVQPTCTKYLTEMKKAGC
jgi:hypothetical protein